jgi:3',5'-cyclic AMP phosphodiesterase CpdA
VVRNPAHLLNKRFLGNMNVWLRRRHEFLLHNADAFADWAAGTGIKDVVLTGDFTSTATHQEFSLSLRFMHRLQQHGLQMAALPGNHDVYTFEAMREHRFERYLNEFVPEGGYPARLTLRGGTPLILIPTVRPNLISSKGFISRRELDAAAALLAACDRPTVVAAHYPVLARTYGYDTKSSRRLINAAALHELLGSVPHPLLYVCGHVHRFSLVRDRKFPHVTHVSTGAFFRDARESKRQGEFTEVQVTRTGFEIYHHTFSGAWARSQAVEPQEHRVDE